jgi:DNA-directed RNA polymerase subunit RPC12/RpoP
MNVYNKHDVEVLEEVYLKIRPWIRNHPNLGTYSKDYVDTCPNCGSINMIDNGEYHTPANVYTSYRCGNCGALSRSRKGTLDIDKKNTLLRN